MVSPLEDLDYFARLVVTNAATIRDGKYAANVLKSIENTGIGHRKKLFETLDAFFKAHGKYPDLVTITALEPTFASVPDPFSGDLAEQFLYRVKGEDIQLKSTSLLASGQFDAAARLMEQMKSSAREEEITVTEIQAAYEKSSASPAGIMFGISELDEVQKGNGYGMPTIIGGPPGMFKTTTLTSFSYNAICAGFSGIDLTFEVMPLHYWYNIYSRHSLAMGNKVPAELIKKSLLTDDQKRFIFEECVPDFTKLQDDPKKGRLFVVGPQNLSGVSYGSIIAKLEAIDDKLLAEGKQLDFLCVDYIQQLGFYCPERVDKTQFLNDMVRFFSTICTGFRGRGLVVILGAQVNRTGEIKMAKTKRASQTMLAELNQLDREGHTIIIQYSDAKMRLANQLGVQIVKNRTGRVQDELVNVYVDPECFMVGAPDFRGVFASESLDILGTGASDGMFFA